MNLLSITMKFKNQTRIEPFSGFQKSYKEEIILNHASNFSKKRIGTIRKFLASISWREKRREDISNEEYSYSWS